MQFEEAMLAMREGHVVKRKHWDDLHSQLSIKQVMVWNRDKNCTVDDFEHEDMMANDWEIVK